MTNIKREQMYMSAPFLYVRKAVCYLFHLFFSY